jgi:hypothetical protein
MTQFEEIEKMLKNADIGARSWTLNRCDLTSIISRDTSDSDPKLREIDADQPLYFLGERFPTPGHFKRCWTYCLQHQKVSDGYQPRRGLSARAHLDSEVSEFNAAVDAFRAQQTDDTATELVGEAGDVLFTALRVVTVERRTTRLSFMSSLAALADAFSVEFCEVGELTDLLNRLRDMSDLPLNDRWKGGAARHLIIVECVLNIVGRLLHVDAFKIVVDYNLAKLARGTQEEALPSLSDIMSRLKIEN